MRRLAILAVHFLRPPARRWLGIALTLGLLIRVYWFIGSANHPGEWPRYMDYYDLMAEGFRGGHLYVPVEPHPSLMAQSNPYDPVHVKLWFWDVSLWKGRYYMYWGPVPGLLQWLGKVAFGVPRSHMVGDQYLVFGMFSLAAVGGALLLERLQRRLFPSLPTWLLLLAIFAFGMANPAPHLVASGGVYQASIAGAQAFLLWGLVFAFDSVWRSSGRMPVALLVLAGTCWGLALGSRISMLPAVAALASLTALACSYRVFPPKSKVMAACQSAALVAAPLGLAVGALLTYNKLRFDSFTEFGTNVQLSTLKFRVSTDYWLANTYTYFLRPFRLQCEFPYTFAPWWMPAKEALAGWIGVPEGYLINEPVVGWLRVVIITWWMPFALVSGWQRARSLLRTRAEATPDVAGRTIYLFCVSSFLVLSSLTAVVLLGMYMATMRYLSDVTNGLVLLGSMGAFTLITTRTTVWARGVVTTAVACSYLATIVFGFFLGYQGYTGHFKQFNPRFEARMQERFSTCETTTPAAKTKRHHK